MVPMLRCALARTNWLLAMIDVPPHLAERKAGRCRAGGCHTAELLRARTAPDTGLHPPPPVLLVLGEGQRSTRRARTAAGRHAAAAQRRTVPAGLASRVANM